MDDFEAEEEEDTRHFFSLQGLTFWEVLKRFVKPIVLLLVATAGLLLNASALAHLKRRAVGATASTGTLDLLLSVLALVFTLHCVEGVFLNAFTDLVPSTATTIHPFVAYWLLPLGALLDGVGHYTLLLMALERLDVAKRMATPGQSLTTTRNYKLYLTIVTLALLPVCSVYYFIMEVKTFDKESHLSFAVDFLLAVKILVLIRFLKGFLPGLASLGIALRVHLLLRRRRRQKGSGGIIPLEEEEEEEEEDRDEEEVGTEPTSAAGRAGQEFLRQSALTSAWLRMSCFHAACEALPLFFVAACDLPQVLSGGWRCIVPMRVMLAFFNLSHLAEVAKASFTTVFFFAPETRRAAADIFHKIRSWKPI